MYKKSQSLIRLKEPSYIDPVAGIYGLCAKLQLDKSISRPRIPAKKQNNAIYEKKYADISLDIRLA